MSKRMNMIIFFILIFLIQFSYLLSSCPNNCNGHGTCDEFSRCTCTKQYWGPDCSYRVCPKGPAWNDFATSTDTAHHLATCSNRGLCEKTTGTCLCMEGFVGAACERLDCYSSCGGYGKCLTMSDLAKYTRDLKSNSYTYDTVWDAHKIKGCTCDPEFYGYDCSLRNCPDGDDPLTTGQVNTIQLVRCIANTGSFVLYYKGYPSRTIYANDDASTVKAALEAIPFITSVSITFSQNLGTVCQTDTNIVSVEFLDQFGELPPLVPLMDSDMSVNGRVTIAADGVTSFTDVSGNIVVSQLGTKEADVCANRGVCATVDGLCLCFATNGDSYGSSNGYGGPGTRGDCGYITSGDTVSTCPGGIECSGHGVCVTPEYRCTCSAGWSGGDCSERTCPYGLSWYSYPSTHEEAHFDYTLCSSMGTCDISTGTCVCRPGFFGAACQNMGCGGGTTTPCNGHGQCLNMYELSLNSELNGELLTDILTGYEGYGLDPNNQNTWDGKRIHGCICDKGYEGYDCSELSCPVGDDPGTYKDHNEVQLLSCRASSGQFTLKFRNIQTPLLNYTITSHELSQVLSSIPSMGKITVTYLLDGLPPDGTLNTTQPKSKVNYLQPKYVGLNTSILNPTDQNRTWNLQGTPFCTTNTSAPQIAIIHFDTLSGDLPPIRVFDDELADIINFNGLPGTGAITRAVDGATMDSLGAAGVISSVRGTTEVAVCNNRGLCNSQTGVCDCFPDWYSSDGFGHAGSTGDCGFRKDETGIII